MGEATTPRGPACDDPSAGDHFGFQHRNRELGDRKVDGRFLALVCNFGWAQLIGDLPLG